MAHSTYEKVNQRSIAVVLKCHNYYTVKEIQIPDIPVERTQENNYWLLPKPSIWGVTELVITPNRNYTANDYESLFTDIEYEQGFEMYTVTAAITVGFPAPNAPVYCFYGTGIDTPKTVVYNSSFPNVPPVYADLQGGMIIATTY